jgi:hypothetical protein
MATAAERMRALRERACRGIRRLTIDEGRLFGLGLVDWSVLLGSYGRLTAFFG